MIYTVNATPAVAREALRDNSRADHLFMFLHGILRVSGPRVLDWRACGEREPSSPHLGRAIVPASAQSIMAITCASDA